MKNQSKNYDLSPLVGKFIIPISNNFKTVTEAKRAFKHGFGCEVKLAHTEAGIFVARELTDSDLKNHVFAEYLQSLDLENLYLSITSYTDVSY